MYFWFVTLPLIVVILLLWWEVTYCFYKVVRRNKYKEWTQFPWWVCLLIAPIFLPYAILDDSGELKY